MGGCEAVRFCTSPYVTKDPMLMFVESVLCERHETPLRERFLHREKSRGLKGWVLNSDRHDGPTSDDAEQSVLIRGERDHRTERESVVDKARTSNILECS